MENEQFVLPLGNEKISYKIAEDAKALNVSIDNNNVSKLNFGPGTKQKITRFFRVVQNEDDLSKSTTYGKQIDSFRVAGNRFHVFEYFTS